MPRTDAGAESMSRHSPLRVSLRKLLALPAALALLAALATPAVAAEEPTSGYTHTEPAKQETLPAKETTPEEPAPTETTPKSEPAPTTTQAKATTLPYTGLNLTWVVGLGLVLMGAGFSIVIAQRRQRRSDS
jgi:LPXTG-motif cell wall-anchored protein